MSKSCSGADVLSAVALLTYWCGCATAPAGAPGTGAVAAAGPESSALRPMLGGKLLVEVPLDAVVKPNPHDLMAPEPSHRVKDNLWIERDGFRFAVVASETFLGCDASAAALPPLGSGVSDVKIAFSHPGVSAIVRAREPPDRTGQTTFFGDAWICLPDATATELMFVTNLVVLASHRRPFADQALLDRLRPRPPAVAPPASLMTTASRPQKMVFSFAMAKPSASAPATTRKGFLAMSRAVFFFAPLTPARARVTTVGACDDRRDWATVMAVVRLEATAERFM